MTEEILAALASTGALTSHRPPCRKPELVSPGLHHFCSAATGSVGMRNVVLSTLCQMFEKKRPGVIFASTASSSPGIGPHVSAWRAASSLRVLIVAPNRASYHASSICLR